MSENNAPLTPAEFRAEVDALKAELSEDPLRAFVGGAQWDAPYTPTQVAAGRVITQSIQDLAKQLGLKTEMGLEALKIALSNIQTLDRKQQDYGPGNISSFGELGVLVRSNDKIERLKNLHKTGRLTDPANESVTDSWLDLSNYGIIATLIRLGLWK